MNNDFEKEVIERLTAIETMLKMQDYKGLEKKANETYNLALQNRKDIDEIKDKNKWYYRTIVGAVLTTIVGLVIAFIKIS